MSEKAGLGLQYEFTGHRFAGSSDQGSCAPEQRIALRYLVRNRNRDSLPRRKKQFQEWKWTEKNIPKASGYIVQSPL